MTLKKTSLVLLSVGTFFCKSQTMYTYAGTGISGFSGDGNWTTAAKTSTPTGVTIDNSGNIYIADLGNKRIRKGNNSGIISTVAGDGTIGSGGDGGSATSAQLNYPPSICVDASGNIYISDQANNRIRKVNTSGIISTIAGTGVAGFSGDGGLATSAQINYPYGITVDASGNIFFADFSNARVRKINTSGIITTIAGTGVTGNSGDGGPATSAQIWAPTGITVDALGNVYFTDQSNHLLKKINTSGIINTIAGTNTSGYTGDGGPATTAKLNFPRGVAIDGFGNIYIADRANHAIRKINTSGTISTIAGTGTGGFNGDGGNPTFTKLFYPTDVTCDAAGNLYIADSWNNRVRLLCASTCTLSSVGEINPSRSLFEIYPNPTSELLNISNNSSELNYTFIEIINCLGQSVLSIPYSKTIDISSLSKGIYNIKISTIGNSIFYSKFIKE